MSYQVLKGLEAKIAIELLRTPDDVLVVRLDPDSCMVELATLPLEYDEKMPEMGPGQFAHRFFNREWHPLMKGGAPYPVAEAARKIIKGTLVPPQGFKTGALSALADCLPAGDHHLFDIDEGLIGRFESADDLKLIANASGLNAVYTFSTPEEIRALPLDVQQNLVGHLAAEGSKPLDKPLTKKQSLGTFDMAKAAAKKKQAKKVVKAQNKIKRADGPVAKARAIFEKMKDKDTPAILAACDAASINRGTATTQLGRWRKENGIVVKRGGPRDHKKTPAAASAKPAKKAAKKKAGGIPSTPAALKQAAAAEQKPAEPPKPADAAPPAPPVGETKPADAAGPTS